MSHVHDAGQARVDLRSEVGAPLDARSRWGEGQDRVHQHEHAHVVEHPLVDRYALDVDGLAHGRFDVAQQRESSMNPVLFFHWLQGYFELHGVAIGGPNVRQPCGDEHSGPKPHVEIEHVLTQAQAKCISRRAGEAAAWLGEGKKGGGAHPDTIAALYEVRTLVSLFEPSRSDEFAREFTQLVVKIVSKEVVRHARAAS
jgi:hypothetical protein